MVKDVAVAAAYWIVQSSATGSAMFYDYYKALDHYKSIESEDCTIKMVIMYDDRSVSIDCVTGNMTMHSFENDRYTPVEVEFKTKI